MLPKCEPFPGPRSVLVMDNASIHHSAELDTMCHDAGVQLLYLPPYSPDLNPIEEFFAELKAFVRKTWRIKIQADAADIGTQLERFREHLQWCVNEIGCKDTNAEAHFRSSSISN